MNSFKHPKWTSMDHLGLSWTEKIFKLQGVMQNSFIEPIYYGVLGARLARPSLRDRISSRCPGPAGDDHAGRRRPKKDAAPAPGFAQKGAWYIWFGWNCPIMPYLYSCFMCASKNSGNSDLCRGEDWLSLFSQKDIMQSFLACKLGSMN